jgi:hypothetical protein
MKTATIELCSSVIANATLCDRYMIRLLFGLKSIDVNTCE